MARATNIYLVESFRDSYDGTTIAAFTVKHECAAYLRKHSDLTGLYVTRVADGRDIEQSAPVTLTAERFIA